jgi:glycosyltransferase involved in cell wall biosynthesis
MVTVLIPCNNLHSWLETSISSSVRALELVGGELLIVLDGVLKKDLDNYITGGNFPTYLEIKVIESPGRGIVDALNIGLNSAKYELIARMDADDEMLPMRLLLQRDYLLDNPHVVAVGGSIELIDEVGRHLRNIYYPIQADLLREKLKTGSFMAHPAVMFRKSRVREVGNYRDLFPYAEDFDLWIRLLEVGELANLEEKVIRYRQHPNQISNLKRNTQEISTESLIWINRVKSGECTPPEWFPESQDDLPTWLNEIKRLNLDSNAGYDEIRGLMRIRNLLHKSSYIQVVIPILNFAFRNPRKFFKLLVEKIRRSLRMAKKSTTMPFISTSSSKENHIHIMLNGGFGNQLFQYAFGEFKRSEYEVDVYYDVSSYEGNSLRGATIVNEGIIDRQSIAERCDHGERLSEQNFTWEDLKIPNNSCCVIEGYWQSWRYTKAETLLTLKQRFSLNENKAGITIHLRGGDYRTNSTTRNYHGLLDEKYYAKALAILPRNLPIRVVTDDIFYADEIFKKMGITPTELQCSEIWVEDFKALVNSQYLVIANSSFSWWAAHLGDAQAVVAPRDWFTPEVLRKNNISDLFPEGWYLC